MYMYTYVHTYSICVLLPKLLFSRMQHDGIYTYIYIHIYIHIYIYMYIYIHICAERHVVRAQVPVKVE